MKIAIFGNSGSGNSTLAGWLRKRWALPVLDLDTIAWAEGATPTRRPTAESQADLYAICSGPSWVIEGCYEDLIACSFPFRPHLLFLNPGMEQCIAHCRQRPWEPHKYASREEQEQRLNSLLDWVREYESRVGPMSLQAHRACFEGYAGPKIMLTERIEWDHAPQALLDWLESPT